MEKYHTQWAAQFYSAAELTRRSYTVALTLGNARGTDLLVAKGKTCFSVQGKGATNKVGWFVKESPFPEADLFILVYVPKEDENSPPQFFVLTREETKTLVEQFVATCMKKQGISREDAEKRIQAGRIQTGVGWKDAQPHKDKWGKLPPEKRG